MRDWNKGDENGLNLIPSHLDIDDELSLPQDEDDNLKLEINEPPF